MGRVMIAAALAASLGAAGVASAQVYPSRSVTLVVS
jgi:tripartite-type tricarboxylate transporter receptor subunit TctC